MRIASSASTDSTRRSRFLPGYVVLTIGITLIGIGLSITRPYLSLFGTDVIHMSPAGLGIFMCMNALGGIVASTWLGRMSDTRTPKKDVMLFSSVMAGLGYASFLVFHDYLVLLAVSTVLLGLGSATFPQMFAYARESTLLSPNVDATFAITTLRSFFSLAWVIGPMAGVLLLNALGYNGLFTMTSAIFAAVFVIVLFFLKRRSVVVPNGARPAGVFTYLKQVDVLMSCVSFVAVYTASSINGSYMSLFITQTLHAPEHDVGWVFSLSAGLEIPIMLGLGTIANRVGKRMLLLFGSICGTGYYVGAAFAHTVWQMLALQLVCAVFISISVSIGMSYMQDFMPDAPGSATTLYSNTNNIGSMAGSLIGGAIAQAFGFRALYVFCAALGAISYFLLLRRRTEQSREVVEHVKRG
ncbi:putative sugar efflux transporter [Alicyclobacillus acidoterrestris]|uniref:sugar efflux transporter n=1 Tax=Alicyclobacillus suci TaxID=2816080 RepID=UPI001190EB6B|nr:sugar efflux transporter [Alicyclobacillus suci]GEO25972.1 putative sugar efflux transporter [Alicyclobacillus acidoterrestris]